MPPLVEWDAQQPVTGLSTLAGFGFFGGVFFFVIFAQNHGTKVLDFAPSIDTFHKEVTALITNVTFSFSQHEPLLLWDISRLPSINMNANLFIQIHYLSFTLLPLLWKLKRPSSTNFLLGISSRKTAT